MAGLYIHIPFCVQKCGYCDFYSSTRLEMRGRLHAALMREMEREQGFLEGRTLDTIYIGGGTPTVYAPAELQMLVEAAKGLWGLAPGGEVTVEANPDDLTPAYLEGLAAAGVNRLSIGIQSFIDRDLRLMNRRHTAQAAVGAVRDARAAGFGNVTIDLIYGIPGMSPREWEDNISTALGLGVEHISAYHLTIEDDTPFGRAAARGRLRAVDEQTSERHYMALHTMLTGAGYEHYEISNFALPGFRARHNSSYWQGEPYLGIGPAAHSYNGVVRRTFPPSVEAYLDAGPEEYITERLTPQDRYNEYVMTRLRTAEGIDLGEAERLFGAARTARIVQDAAPWLESQTLVVSQRRMAVPPARMLVSDAVIESLFESE